MALVSRYGDPTLFITGTANPRWPGLLGNSPAGRTAFDFPIETCRVFKLKLARFSKMVKSGAMFPNLGEVLYVLTVVEFHRGGLPHFHLAVKFATDVKSPELVDQIISAEISPAVEKWAKLLTHEHRNGCDRRGPPCSSGYPRAEELPTRFCARTGHVFYRRRGAENAMTVEHSVRTVCMGWPRMHSYCGERSFNSVSF